MAVSFRPRLTVNGIRYGESASAYYWDPSINIYAVNKNWMLANCTCYAYGRALEIGSPAPIGGAPWYAGSAFHWNVSCINGWYSIPYSVRNVTPGDILQWGDYDNGVLYPNHVAFVETKSSRNVITVSFSNWTARDASMTPAQISAYFQSTPYLQGRFFNTTTNMYVGGELPRYILKNPGNPGPGPQPPGPTGDDVVYPIAIGNKWGLRVGDKVKIIGTGKAAADGSGGNAYGIGWIRYIQDIYENGAYPIRVGFRNSNATTGFYKGDALEKIE